VAKSKRRRQQRQRRPGGHPAQRTPAPLRSPAEIELEREAELAFAEAQRRYEETLSPDTPTERVAALVVEEFEDLPSPPGLAIRLRRDGSEERDRLRQVPAGACVSCAAREREASASTAATGPAIDRRA
jgi:hypothetical protein